MSNTQTPPAQSLHLISLANQYAVSSPVSLGMYISTSAPITDMPSANIPNWNIKTGKWKTVTKHIVRNSSQTQTKAF